MLALPVLNGGINSNGRLASTPYEIRCISVQGMAVALVAAPDPKGAHYVTCRNARKLDFDLHSRDSPVSEDVRLLVTRCDSKLESVMDLTEVMFIDAVGEDVLSLIELGGRSWQRAAYARDICERLQLPLVHKHKQNQELASNRNGNGHSPIANSRRL